MKKKILSLFLALVMMLSVALVGCSDDSDTGETSVSEAASESTITLSMYVVTENEVAQYDQDLVTRAFNAITKSKFKTQVVLHFLTYDNYYSTIQSIVDGNAAYEALKDEHDAELKAAKKNAKALGIATDSQWFDDFYEQNPQYADFRETEELTGDDTTAEETVQVTIEGVEGYTITEVKYPEEKAYQLDIVWIDSYDRYMEFIENEWLERLDDELGSASKKLKEYINPTLLSWAKWAGSGTYAIPNNSVLGEYTYLLLNKELMDKYNYDASSLTTLAKCADFLADVAKYESSVQPVYGELPVTNAFYWSYDEDGRKIISDKFNLLGNVVSNDKSLDPSSTTNSFIGAKNIFTLGDYTTQLRAIQSYKDAGYVSETIKDGQTYALRVVKGNADLAAEYGDEYYMNVLECPRIDEDAVFSSMFGVTTFTRSLTRSMEIITYLNTNSELRNVLQYGVENVHYTVNSDGTITRLNNNYMMNIRNTGNVFVAYPEEGMSADAWTYGKQQNLDAKSDVINCFRVSEEQLVQQEGSEDEPLNLTEINTLKTVSEEIEKEYAAIKNSEELEAFISKYSNSNATVIKNQSTMSKTSGIYGLYYNWMLDKNLYIIEEG